jgi:preprotein translocase subunit SecE
MAKENRAVSSGRIHFFGELLRTDIYKRSQGRLVRQLTCLAIWIAFALASYQMYHVLPYIYRDWFKADAPRALVYALPTLVLLAGLWLGYRIVNLPTFADFLIAVEAEMNKVSWPSRTELIRASMVVIILMFGLTLVLFFYDVILTTLLKAIGVVI